MLVLGMRNYADTFFVDFVVDHEPTASTRAVMPAYFCGIPLRSAVNTKPVWYVSFSSLPKSSPSPPPPPRRRCFINMQRRFSSPVVTYFDTWSSLPNLHAHLYPSQTSSKPVETQNYVVTVVYHFRINTAAKGKRPGLLGIPSYCVT